MKYRDGVLKHVLIEDCGESWNSRGGDGGLGWTHSYLRCNICIDPVLIACLTVEPEDEPEPQQPEQDAHGV